jgi:Relaxase/Mobilisation nuclease domain
VKCIIKIQPVGKCTRRLLRHLYLPEGRMGREVKAINDDGNRVVDRLNGVQGAMTMQPALDAETLSGGIKDRSPYRHVLISFEDCADDTVRRESVAALHEMGKEWMERFAPETPYLGVVHDDREHLHLHLALRNEDLNGKALGWSRDDLRLMQSMDWVSGYSKINFGIESGRKEKGPDDPKSSAGPYPLARSLDAKTLAESTQEQLYEYERTGALSIGRVNKQGTITSVVFGGRRIRLATIRGLADRVGRSSGFGSGDGSKVPFQRRQARPGHRRNSRPNLA